MSSAPEKYVAKISRSRGRPRSIPVRAFARADSGIIVFNKMKTILLLTLSNAFMNLAWYGHLKFKNSSLWLAILASWGIAFFEYRLSSPGQSHWSHSVDGAAAKGPSGSITLIVFTFVAFGLFSSPLKWNYLVSYGFIVGSVFFAFKF